MSLVPREASLGEEEPKVEARPISYVIGHYVFALLGK